MALVLGPDGKKLAKRDPEATVAALRGAGIPGEAARRYLEELELPRHDVRYDLPRIRRLAIEALAALSDEELAERAGVPATVVPVPPRRTRSRRGARVRAKRARFAASDEAGRRARDARALPRPGEPRATRDPARAEAVGGDLRAPRLALTGRERGPELWAVLAALPRDEGVRRVEAAL
jgi:hypothetical protein